MTLSDFRKKAVCLFKGHDWVMHGKEISPNVIMVTARRKRCGCTDQFVTFMVDKKDFVEENA